MRALLIASLTLGVSLASAAPTPAPSPAPPSPAPSPPPLRLGVLEHHLAHPNDTQQRPFARVLFEKQGGTWRAFPSEAADSGELAKLHLRYPEKLDWTVCHAGAAIGKLATRRHLLEAYMQAGRHDQAGTAPVPRRGEPSEELSGWMGGKVYRPLALVTQPRCAEPDGWAPASVTAATRARVLAALAAEIKRENVALVDTGDGPTDKLDPVLRRELRAAKREVAAVHRSRGGAQLVTLRLRQKELGETRLLFAVAAGATAARFLGSWLTFVDAGDYDGDGRAELLLRSQRYNEDGYLLLDASLKPLASFSWHYH